MKSGSAFIGFMLSAALGFAVGYTAGAGTGPRPVKKARRAPPPTPKKAQKAAPTRKSDVYKVPVGDSYAKGETGALITVVTFSEFQCPFCKKVQPTLAELEKKYGQEIRFVFKHQPLPFHLQAPKASEYALAAGAQGKFWEMHDVLFENSGALQEENLKRYAEEIGLDLGQVQAFIESGRGKEVIRADQTLARQLGATGTPTFFVNGVRLTGAQPLANFVTVIEAELLKAKKALDRGVPRTRIYETITQNGWEEVPRARRPAQPPTTRQKVKLVDGTPTKGAAKPLVTIVEFSDFQCPFCARVNPTLEKVLAKYGDSVQLRFRNQPLDFHKRAVPAARAALAAHSQGKFWEMHDLLFKNQRALSDEDLTRYARRLKLDLTKFSTLKDAAVVTQRIKADRRDAGVYGARATPTMFVNGIPIRGAQPYATFKQVIEMEIERAKKLISEGIKPAAVYDEILRREGGKEVKIPGSA